eukprot:Partr_v1_DN25934_c1_g1_i3_m68573 putative Methyltransferase-like protein
MVELNSLNPSPLGTKKHWDEIYQRDLDNYASFGDIGEIWFGEKSVTTMVKWISKNMDTSSEILELGCGNGHLLFELEELAYIKLQGVDYSPEAISLASKIAHDNNSSVTFQVMDILNEATDEHKFDLILDKGTFDAITLKPENELDLKQRGDPEAINKYKIALRKLLKCNGGRFLIASCNWTVDELQQIFVDDTMRLLTPSNLYVASSFTFGGQTGSPIAVLVFETVGS